MPSLAQAINICILYFSFSDLIYGNSLCLSMPIWEYEEYKMTKPVWNLLKKKNYNPEREEKEKNKNQTKPSTKHKTTQNLG